MMSSLKLYGMSSHSFARTLNDETGYCAGSRWRGLFQERSILPGRGLSSRRGRMSWIALSTTRDNAISTKPNCTGWARGRINDPMAGAAEVRRVLAAFADQGVRVNLGFYSGLLADLEAETLGADSALAASTKLSASRTKSNIVARSPSSIACAAKSCSSATLPIPRPRWGCPRAGLTVPAGGFERNYLSSRFAAAPVGPGIARLARYPPVDHSPEIRQCV